MTVRLIDSRDGASQRPFFYAYFFDNAGFSIGRERIQTGSIPMGGNYNTINTLRKRIPARAVRIELRDSEGNIIGHTPAPQPAFTPEPAPAQTTAPQTRNPNENPWHDCLLCNGLLTIECTQCIDIYTFCATCNNRGFFRCNHGR